jgi:hypothetical protein
MTVRTDLTVLSNRDRALNKMQNISITTEPQLTPWISIVSIRRVTKLSKDKMKETSLREAVPIVMARGLVL